MSPSHFDDTEKAELRAKIDEAKRRRLPLHQLLSRLGLGEHAKEGAHCPFHDDEHKSFSVFKGNDGCWHWKCFAGCGEGDEIIFLSKLKALSLTEAINLYLSMASFPARTRRKSHEYPQSPQSHEYPQSPQSHECPESPECHESPKSPVYPVSNGQGVENTLKELAERNACTKQNTARKKRFQLVRDLRALELTLKRQLEMSELILALHEWYRRSRPSLNFAKTAEYYLAAFVAELRKVRFPSGENETLKKALDYVSKLPVCDLPMIPGVPDAPESWRRLAALHRELARRCGGKPHFLSCRDAAKVFPGLCHQTAYNINLNLAHFGIIAILRVGDSRPGGRASQYRYILPENDQGHAEIGA
jgi:CHC2 zinc finger